MFPTRSRSPLVIVCNTGLIYWLNIQDEEIMATKAACQRLSSFFHQDWSCCDKGFVQGHSSWKMDMMEAASLLGLIKICMPLRIQTNCVLKAREVQTDRGTEGDLSMALVFCWVFLEDCHPLEWTSAFCSYNSVISIGKCRTILLTTLSHSFFFFIIYLKHQNYTLM